MPVYQRSYVIYTSRCIWYLEYGIWNEIDDDVDDDNDDDDDDDAWSLLTSITIKFTRECALV